MAKNPHAAALGRMTSPRKAKTSRANGRLGGWKPRRYCELCDKWVSQRECRACGAATVKRLAAPTDDDIKALRAAAAEAGDLAQVAICDRALRGSARARAECRRVIAETAAMAASD